MLTSFDIATTAPTFSGMPPGEMSRPVVSCESCIARRIVVAQRWTRTGAARQADRRDRVLVCLDPDDAVASPDGLHRQPHAANNLHGVVLHDHSIFVQEGYIPPFAMRCPRWMRV